MGAWGSGSFENDDAEDFLRDLQSKEIDDLGQILARATDQDYLGAPDSRVVVAAAEAIAMLKGAPPQPVPSEIAEWASKVQGAPTASLNELARRAVSTVRLNSELKDLWLEAEGLNEWSASLRDLEQRLVQ